jgi:peptidoglycan/xylan/chitin deacetylase (PgdA/CDA1 family)
MADVLVLCYHAVSDDWQEPFAVTPARLEDQLRRLLAAGYRGATFSQAVLEPGSERTLSVTFDDGYRSVIERAWPILSGLGLPATAFVCTDFMGSSRPMRVGLDRWLTERHEHELLPMGWDDLARLADAGWEIGSHTATHARLIDLDDESLASELRGSREACEQALGANCGSIAYPHGAADARVVAAARAAGYRAGGSLLGGFDAGGELSQPRVAVYRGDGTGTFRLKSSRSARRLRASAAWPLVAPLARLALTGRRQLAAG